MHFPNRSGVSYGGFAFANCSVPSSSCASYWTAATATLSGERNIHVSASDRGVTYKGTLNADGTLTLVQNGGAQSGRTWQLRYYEAV